MAAAMAKASELQLATDKLAVAAIQSQQQIKVRVLLPECSQHNTGGDNHFSQLCDYHFSRSKHSATLVA